MVNIVITNSNKYEQTALKKLLKIVVLDSLSLLALIFGFLVTYLVIYSINGDETLIIIFKGISIQVLLNTFISLNISEMTLWFYFLALTIVIITINFLFKTYYTNKRQDLFGILFVKLFKLFTEGSLILPLFLMVAFPFIVQTFLPTIIYGVLLIEMIVPFMITGRLFKKSGENFKILVIEKYRSLKDLQYFLISLFYPLFIFLMIWSNIDVFYSLVHYNFLWDNPKSSIAVALWDFLDQVVIFLEFGNTSFHDILYHSILYINALIILTICSIIYLICEAEISKLLKYAIQEKLMPYN